MAGYNKQSKNYSNKTSSSSFSFSNLFRSRRSTARREDDAHDEAMALRRSTARRVDDAYDEAMAPRKIWASDYDKGKYVAEPGIDRRATTFIENRKSRFMEYERPTIVAV